MNLPLLHFLHFIMMLQMVMASSAHTKHLGTRHYNYINNNNKKNKGDQQNKQTRALRVSTDTMGYTNTAHQKTRPPMPTQEFKAVSAPGTLISYGELFRRYGAMKLPPDVHGAYGSTLQTSRDVKTRTSESLLDPETHRDIKSHSNPSTLNMHLSSTETYHSYSLTPTPSLESSTQTSNTLSSETQLNTIEFLDAKRQTRRHFYEDIKQQTLSKKQTLDTFEDAHKTSPPAENVSMTPSSQSSYLKFILLRVKEYLKDMVDTIYSSKLNQYEETHNKTERIKSESIKNAVPFKTAFELQRHQRTKRNIPRKDYHAPRLKAERTRPISIFSLKEINSTKQPKGHQTSIEVMSLNGNSQQKYLEDVKISPVGELQPAGEPQTKIMEDISGLTPGDRQPVSNCPGPEGCNTSKTSSDLHDTVARLLKTVERLQHEQDKQKRDVDNLRHQFSTQSATQSATMLVTQTESTHYQKIANQTEYRLHAMDLRMTQDESRVEQLRSEINRLKEANQRLSSILKNKNRQKRSMEERMESVKFTREETENKMERLQRSRSRVRAKRNKKHRRLITNKKRPIKTTKKRSTDRKTYSFTANNKGEIKKNSMKSNYKHVKSRSRHRQHRKKTNKKRNSRKRRRKPNLKDMQKTANISKPTTKFTSSLKLYRRVSYSSTDKVSILPTHVGDMNQVLSSSHQTSSSSPSPPSLESSFLLSTATISSASSSSSVSSPSSSLYSPPSLTSSYSPSSSILTTSASSRSLEPSLSSSTITSNHPINFHQNQTPALYIKAHNSSTAVFKPEIYDTRPSTQVNDALKHTSTPPTLNLSSLDVVPASDYSSSEQNSISLNVPLMTSMDMLSSLRTVLGGAMSSHDAMFTVDNTLALTKTPVLTTYSLAPGLGLESQPRYLENDVTNVKSDVEELRTVSYDDDTILPSVNSYTLLITDEPSIQSSPESAFDKSDTLSSTTSYPLKKSLAPSLLDTTAQLTPSSKPLYERDTNTTLTDSLQSSKDGKSYSLWPSHSEKESTSQPSMSTTLTPLEPLTATILNVYSKFSSSSHQLQEKSESTSDPGLTVESPTSLFPSTLKTTISIQDSPATLVDSFISVYPSATITATSEPSHSLPTSKQFTIHSERELLDIISPYVREVIGNETAPIYAEVENQGRGLTQTLDFLMGELSKRDTTIKQLEGMAAQTSIQIVQLARQVSSINMHEFLTKLDESLGEFSQSVLTLEQWKDSTDRLIAATNVNRDRISELQSVNIQTSSRFSRIETNIDNFRSSTQRWYRNLQGHMIRLNNTAQDMKEQLDKKLDASKVKELEALGAAHRPETEAKLDSLHIQLLYNANRLSKLETKMLNATLAGCRSSREDYKQTIQLQTLRQQYDVTRNEIFRLKEKVKKMDVNLFHADSKIKSNQDIVVSLRSEFNHMSPSLASIGVLKQEVQNLAQQVPQDCHAYFRLGYRKSQIYTVKPGKLKRTIRVFCYMDVSPGPCHTTEQVHSDSETGGMKDGTTTERGDSKKPKATQDISILREHTAFDMEITTAPTQSSKTSPQLPSNKAQRLNNKKSNKRKKKRKKKNTPKQKRSKHGVDNKDEDNDSTVSPTTKLPTGQAKARSHKKASSGPRRGDISIEDYEGISQTFARKRRSTRGDIQRFRINQDPNKRPWDVLNPPQLSISSDPGPLQRNRRNSRNRKLRQTRARTKRTSKVKKDKKRRVTRKSKSPKRKKAGNQVEKKIKNKQDTTGNKTNFLIPSLPLSSKYGGWTVIQRRRNGITNFSRPWSDYVNGFGDVDEGEDYWLGNEAIHQLTRLASVELRVIVEDMFSAMWEASYKNFRVGDSARNYHIQVSGYHGNASDGLGGASGTAFSTLDHKSDPAASSHCARYNGGGWWYPSCHVSNLNGPWGLGMLWYNRAWSDWLQLKTTIMMVRPSQTCDRRTDRQKDG